MHEGMYRLNECDESKIKIAKLKLNSARLMVSRPAGHRHDLKEIDFEIAQIMQRVAANPRYCDVLLCTKVKISIPWLVGKDEINAMFDLALKHQAQETQLFDDLVIANGGELIELIPLQLEKWSYAVEKPVLCEDYFTVSALCDHSRATRLCNMLHADYADEIRTSRLIVSREFSGFHFPDLITFQDAEDYIRQMAEVRSCN